MIVIGKKRTITRAGPPRDPLPLSCDRRSVVPVKKGPAIVGLGLVVALLVAGPAAAQGKDPFMPPAGSGGPGATAGTGGTTGGGAPVVAPPEPRAGENLPRTGLDLSVPVLAAWVLIAAGASMRLTTAALSP
jgi:hypothetical protein